MSHNILTKKEKLREWKEKQLKAHQSQASREYFYENESLFILIFDMENRVMNFEIEKNELTCIEDVTNKAIEIRNTKRTDKTIIKEFFTKASLYLKTNRRTIDYNRNRSIQVM